MKAHLRAIFAIALTAIASGATFLFALFRQFGVVEAVASLGAAVEVYFLSSAIGDYLDGKPAPNSARMLISFLLAAGIICFFLFARWRSLAA